MHKSAHDRLKRLELESEQQEREQFNLLLDITQALTSELNLESLIQLVMDKTRDALRADRCSVFLLDGKTNELWTIAAHGMDGGEIRVPVDMGIAGHVAMTGNILNVKDAYKDPRFDQSVDKRTNYRTSTILCMPMKNRQGEIIGVFQILNKKKGAFNNTDERILGGVASAAAIAVENSQLVHRYQHREFDRFIEILSQAVDARNPVNTGHSCRVARLASLLAEQAGCEPEFRSDLHFASLLHDFWEPELLTDFFRRYGDVVEERYGALIAMAARARKILAGAPYPSAVKPLLKLNAYPEIKLKPADAPVDERGAAFLALADLFDMLTYETHRKPRLSIGRVFSVVRRSLHGRIPAEVIDGLFALPLDRLLLAMTAGTPYRIGFKDRERLGGITAARLEECAVRRGHRSAGDTDILNLFNGYYTL